MQNSFRNIFNSFPVMANINLEATTSTEEYFLGESRYN
jgi:hypothetical protein